MGPDGSGEGGGGGISGSNVTAQRLLNDWLIRCSKA